MQKAVRNDLASPAPLVAAAQPLGSRVTRIVRRALERMEDRVAGQGVKTQIPLVRLRKLAVFDRFLARRMQIALSEGRSRIFALTRAKVIG